MLPNLRLFPAFATALAALCSSAASGFEVRVGGAVTNMELVGGLFPDAPSFNIANLDSVQGQLFWEPPVDLSWLFNPRLELGGLLNLKGRESYVYGGLNWHVPLFDTPLYLEAGFGAGLHNGAATGAVAPFRNLGCPFGFHYSYGIGADVGENITLTARFQHLSHAYLCSGPNEGINSVSLAVGYSF